MGPGRANTVYNTRYRARSEEQFPDPFFDMASLAMPQSNAEGLLWAEFLFHSDGTYREAARRTCAYFITDIEINGEDTEAETRREYKEYLTDTLNIKRFTQQLGMDVQCYGISLFSVLQPFRRFLKCGRKDCSVEVPLEVAEGTPVFKFKWTNYEFHATCPRCSYTGKWQHIDRRGGESDDVILRRWSPHEIDILWDPCQHKKSYIWWIPQEVRKTITEGKIFHLARAHWEVIQAVKNNQNILFDDDVVCALEEDTLAGMNTNGWPISRTIINFRQSWLTKVLKRSTEAIAMDYVIPFRLLTPEPKSGADAASSDPAMGANYNNFVAAARRMVLRRRQDPAGFNFLPHPVRYQALGSEAKQMVPHELIAQSQDDLLNSYGIFAEMYRGTLTTQAAPLALRLFEATWGIIPSLYNQALQHIIDRLTVFKSWEPVTGVWTPVTAADDINRHMAKLQLMGTKDVSKTTALQSLGLQFERETKQVMEEERFMAEQQAKLQEEMDRTGEMAQIMAQPGAAMAPPGGAPPGAGQMPPGGGGAPPAAPAAPGGMPAGQMAAGQFAASMVTSPNAPILPTELWERANTVAGTLMSMPSAQKSSEMIALKRMDPTLHAIVKMILDDQAQQAETQGKQMVMEQQFGKTGSSPITKPFYGSVVSRLLKQGT